MIALPRSAQIPVRFCPSKETLAVLNAGGWDASYSGGKDSTAAVKLIEALRRVEMVRIDKPSLSMSNTGVEWPFLEKTSTGLMEALQASGWTCVVVRPAVHQKLYNQIFGRGLPPIHPGIKRLRWCTRSTKKDPIDEHLDKVRTPLRISGVRWGESDMRDGKLSAGGCAVGGECGLPEPGENVYSPIITWKTCKVVEWLSGDYDPELQSLMADLLIFTRRLVDVYEFKRDVPNLMGEVPAMKSALRFGCMGCPAIQRDKVLKTKQAKSNPMLMHLNRLYGIWEQLWRPSNRLIGWRNGKQVKGPIRMAARKRYFDELLSIQNDSGVELVNAEDVKFIRSCWRKKVYPRGWSETDESVSEPATGLFA